MPTCHNCGEKWTWMQTIRASFRVKLKCPHCEQKQYESAASKIRSGALMLIPLTILPISTWLNLSGVIVLILYIIIALIALSLYPFFLELSNEEEPLW